MSKSQNGYSLVELSIVLAIIAIIIGGSLNGVQSILRGNKVNQIISTANMAVPNIVAKFIRDNNYSGLSLATLTTQGFDIFPSASIVGGGGASVVVTHQFGGRIYVAPLTAATSGVEVNGGFVYSLVGVPIAACADIALGIEGLGGAMSISTTATASAVAAAPSVMAATGVNLVKSLGVPISGAKVSAACTGNNFATISLLVGSY
jgi:prepilin-type N-terminal cleavage/methylation domain-containing protein